MEKKTKVKDKYFLIIYAAIIFASIVIDQITKRIAVKYLYPNGSVNVIPGVFRFTYVENRGMAFGLLQNQRWIFITFSTLAILALAVYLFRWCNESRFFKISLSLIVGGGIGNMIDRIFLGYVIDFLDFCAFPKLWTWIFNVADACVCVGAGLVAVLLVISIVKESKAQSADNKADDRNIEDGDSGKHD